MQCISHRRFASTAPPHLEIDAAAASRAPRTLLALVLALLLLALAPARALAQDEATDDVPATATDGDGDEVDDDTEPATPGDDDATPDGAGADDGGATGDAVDAPAGTDEDAAVNQRLRTDQRLREIGNQVDALKEDTFATKSRLLLLRESVLNRRLGGSKIVVVHKDDMGSEYELVQVLYSLDGEAQLVRREGQDIEGLDDTVVFDKKIVPGSHLLSVAFVYKGNAWGIFSYNEGYTYKLKASETFTVEEGVAYEITVRAFESGGFFTPIEQRPTIAFEEAKHPLENEFASSTGGR